MEEPTGQSSRIELEVRLGLDPIRGHVLDGSGEGRSFSGWIELTSLLERIRSGSEPGERPARRQG